MMQWQVNRLFRKDREAVIAKIPNLDVVVQQLDLPFGPPPRLVCRLIAQIARVPRQGEIQDGQREGAFPVQEHEARVPPECPAPIQPVSLLPEQPVVLSYSPRRMDPNPFPPLARGRRGRGGINPFANNDRNRQGANWGNHPDFEGEEEHREEVIHRPYRIGQRDE
ncbi:unnamed protein product [Prunus armeniaca]